MLGAASSVLAQSDDFDDGDDAGWLHINPVGGLLGGTTTYSFPAGLTGKGYRVQCTTSAAVPGAAGTGRSFNLRTNDYTDFYVSVDVVNWDDSLNQAIVLAARFRGEAEVLDPCPFGAGLCNPGFGVMDGYVANYDPRQNGASATSRLGGQFQINRVLDENPAPTYAVANVVLTPGKSYRFTFRGVGPHLTAEIFDHEDLTAPLVSLETDRATEFPSGKCGLIAFSRDRTTADMTYDNYFAAEYDPFNPPAVPAPAVPHSTAGTPQVVTRVPAARFANFHPATSGISFTATNIAGDINHSAIKLYLNGASVGPLTITGPATGPSVSYAGPLAANTVYTGRIELENVVGTGHSTNVFWFDTFSDAFFDTAPVKVVEAEDYNYSQDFVIGGLFQEDPPVSGIDSNGQQVNGPPFGYFHTTGADEADYSDTRTSPESDAGGLLAAFRFDPVGTQQGDPDDIQDLIHPALVPPFLNDSQRGKYAAVSVLEYQVVRTEYNEWLNYTRTFVNTNYHVYLRVGSLGNTKANFDLVTSDPSVVGQTTQPLGSFLIPNNFRRSNYRYVPLTSAGGPAVLNLSGLKTLRLTQAGVPAKDNRLLALNYLVFVPTSDPVASFIVLESAPTVNGPYTNANADIDREFLSITVPQSGDARFYRIRGEKAYTITGVSVSGGFVTITYTD